MIMILLVKVSSSVQTLAFPRLDAGCCSSSALQPVPTSTTYPPRYHLCHGTFPTSQTRYLSPSLYATYHTISMVLQLSLFIMLFSIPRLHHFHTFPLNLSITFFLDPLHPSTCPHMDNSKSISFKTFVSSGTYLIFVIFRCASIS